ncbi:deoxyuridine 5'-triphosphate nucleotidohydrolase [Peribacillus butanolivorans]|uniref:dUTP diphosphatase n=1 Tax=Peribacillus butanolivorans TaxID=421767 RepID=UPI00207CF55C|nr:deoxyuridine 5'-triphosphate nucleotidohydrolase [Peribacillus butanolivorans]MCO0597400.1 deoxyuridine 5'-triphosphate nucleotidohydrolase [Peribacillus butanolivorans]
MRIRIKKVRDDIPTPSYAYKGDSGYDLIAAKDTIIEPGATVKIPTGLSFEIAEGYELQIRPRSGVTSKTKLRVQLGTIDSNYRGEVSVIVDNVAIISTDERDCLPERLDGVMDGWDADYTEHTYIIRKGDKIAQGVIAPVVQAKFEVVDELDETNRGTGGFGSSGVKS